jgi:hypothetical protein
MNDLREAAYHGFGGLEARHWWNIFTDTMESITNVRLLGQINLIISKEIEENMSWCQPSNEFFILHAIYPT